MGMFDSFYMEIKCPRTGENLGEQEFQTKEFDCLLDEWRAGDKFPHIDNGDIGIGKASNSRSVEAIIEIRDGVVSGIRVGNGVATGEECKECGMTNPVGSHYYWCSENPNPPNTLADVRKAFKEQIAICKQGAHFAYNELHTKKGSEQKVALSEDVIFEVCTLAEQGKLERTADEVG